MAAVSPFPPVSDRPTPSKNVRAVDRQMPLVEKGDPVDVDKSLIHRQKSLLSAIALCAQAAGLQDKELYLPLGIDASHWSRIIKGDAHFPLERLGPLMDLCGNEAPLEWLANSRGYELRPLETEVERLLREETERADELANENRLLREMLVGRGR
jgi:hypothetical protein